MSSLNSRRCAHLTRRNLKIHDETGASVGTRGVWYPDKTKATAKDPPLYIHISAKSKDVLQKAVDKVHELINLDMGSLVDKGEKGRERVSSVSLSRQEYEAHLLIEEMARRKAPNWPRVRS